MNKIVVLIKKGWTIDEIRYDRWNKWFYAHAVHESQEASADGSGATYTEAFDMMYEQAIKSTPAWYLEQL